MRVGFGTWRLLYTGIVLLGMGIAFIVMISGEMSDYAKKGADYSTLQWSDFKEGMMIEGDLPVNYGSYEEIVNDDKNKSIGQFYLIDAGDDCFMGIYTPIDELINSLDDQYDAWSNDEDISPVHFKGNKDGQPGQRLYKGLSYLRRIHQGRSRQLYSRPLHKVRRHRISPGNADHRNSRSRRRSCIPADVRPQKNHGTLSS